MLSKQDKEAPVVFELKTWNFSLPALFYPNKNQPWLVFPLP